MSNKQSLQYVFLKKINLLQYRNKDLRNNIIRDIKDFASFCKENSIDTPEKISDPAHIVQKYCDKMVENGFKRHTALRRIHAACSVLEIPENIINIEKIQ